MFKKILTILVVVCLFAALAVSASARESFYLTTAEGDGITAYVIDVSDLKEGDTGTLTFTAVGYSAEGYRVRLNTSTIDAFEYNDFRDGAGADCPADGQLPAFIQQASGTFTINFTVGGEYWETANTVAIVGWQGSHDFDLSDVSFSVGGAAAPVVTAAAVAGDTNVASDAQKDGADTGAAGIATVIGVAFAATAGVIVSVRKRK
jgi:hypothetical protein